jgi:hypothetical protein
MRGLGATGAGVPGAMDGGATTTGGGVTPRPFIGLVAAKSGCGVDIGTSVPREAKLSSSGGTPVFVAPMGDSIVAGGGVGG